jgi:hypothetical protein
MPSGSKWALNIKGGSTHAQIFNNILIHADPRRGAIQTVPDSLQGLTSDYNVIQGRYTPDDGDRIVDLTTWRSITGQDTHTITAKPEDLFVDAAQFDFHLRAGSVAIDAAEPMFSPRRDRDSRARPIGSRSDIGAYEYGAEPLKN